MRRHGKPRLCLGDLAVFDAAGADPDALGVTVDERFDCLQIYTPAAAGDVVRVRNVVAELRTFPADVAYLCHDFAPNLGVSCRRGKPWENAAIVASHLGLPNGAYEDTRPRQLAESSVYLEWSSGPSAGRL